MEHALSTLREQLAAINASRRVASRHPFETTVEAQHQCSTLLAVYGSLAPGKENHHVIAHLCGGWAAGHVLGKLHAEGWGSTLGYPAIRLQDGPDRVAVEVFQSDDLAMAWDAIDDFEGPDYRRVLTLVFMNDGSRRVANIYEAR